MSQATVEIVGAAETTNLPVCRPQATQSAPHSQFVVSVFRNVRTINVDDVEELADLILAAGMVLQNVIVFRQKRKGKETGKLEIVAGGRRWRAVALLISKKLFPADFPLNYIEVSEEEGIQISLMENSGRMDMHPADQFAAMQALIEMGKTIDFIASYFGMQTIGVKRRLRLANVAPELMDLFKKDEATIEHLEALGLCEDHQRQLDAWKATANRNHAVWAIRDLLTNNTISTNDKAAIYVGVDAYEKAGGTLIRDLFSEEGRGYIENVPLLEKLAAEKLEKQGAKLKKEGFAWVDVAVRFDHADLSKLGTARKVKRELTPEEQGQLDTAQSALDDAQNQRIEIESAGCTPETQKEYTESVNAARKLCRQLRTELDNLNVSFCVIHPDEAPFVGAVVTIDHNGKCEIHRNRLRPDDVKRLKKEAKGESATQADDEDKPALSEKLFTRLTAHRTAALQAETMFRPDMAIILLTYQLVKRSLCDDGHVFDRLLRVSAESAPLTQSAEDMEQSKAYLVIEERRAELKAMLPEEDCLLLPWMLEQSPELINDLMAFCVADSMNTVRGNANRSEELDVFAKAVNLDMRNWWTPTQDSYFKSVRKSHLVDVITSAVSMNDALPMAKMTKDMAAAAAERAIADKGWLPEVLKFD